MPNAEKENLGRPAPNEDKDLNSEQYKSRKRGTVSRPPDPAIAKDTPEQGSGSRKG